MPRVYRESYYFDEEQKQFGSYYLTGYELMFKRKWETLTLPIEEVNPENFYIYNGVIISKKGLKYTLIKYYDHIRRALVDLQIKLPNDIYKIEPHKFISGMYQLKKSLDLEYDWRFIEKFEKIHKKYGELLLNHTVLNRNGLNDKCLIGDDIFPFSRFLWQIGETDWFNLYTDITERTEISLYTQPGERASTRITTPESGILVQTDFITIDISFVSISTKDNETIYNKKCVKKLYGQVVE